MKSVHTDQYNAFLKLIIAARQTSELTQQELANKLNKPQSYVSKYERGERRLDVVEFLALAELMGIDSQDFIDRLRVKSLKKGGEK